LVIEHAATWAGSGARPPTVSVCIPTYNAQTTIGASLDSVWSQTFEDFEVIVSDDCSTDSTPAVLAGQSDPRLRVLRNTRNVKAPANANRALAHARGRLIKFLDADDVLFADCIARMVELAEAHPDVGMVFCRRALKLEDPENVDSRNWSKRFADVSAHFGRLGALNSGPALLARWARHGLDANLVGEPLVVMLRRDVLERAGGFNPYVRQRFDLDLWARIMPLCAVGFISEELGLYRVPAESLTTRNHHLRLDWLDQLWTLEALRCVPEARAAASALAGLHEQERRRVRRELRELFRGEVPARWTRLGDARRMASWLISKRLDPSARPFPRIGPPPPNELAPAAN
jgi:glycosyltransferase involved in cell wall biosynthesis